MSESNYSPKIWVDTDNEVMLVGEAAVEDHYAAMERGGFAVRVLSLDELINGDEPMPSMSTTGHSKYRSVTKEDLIERGHLLAGIVGELNQRKVNRLSKLDLFPSRKTLASSRYFDGFINFTEELGQSETSPHGAYSDWDAVDHAIHLRQVSVEEGQRAHQGILSRRYKEGKPGPSYDTIRKVIPFPEAMELAGFVQPRSKRGYEEWAYLFYLANERLPVVRDFDPLSLKGLGPSANGVFNAYPGGLTELRKQILAMSENRQAIVYQEALGSLKNGIKSEITEAAADQEEIVRRIGRYNIISELLPKLTPTEAVRFSKYDVTGKRFAGYLARLDPRIEEWLVEAAARKNFIYPEIFPNGDFYEQIRMPNKYSSFLSLNPSIDYKLLAEVTKPKKFKERTLLRNERRILALITTGYYKYELYDKLPGISEESTNRLLAGLKKETGAKNAAHLVRIGIIKGWIDTPRSDSRVLTLKERQVLELISHGAEMSAVGKIFDRGPAYMTAYSKSALTKLGARTRAHAVALGFSTGDLQVARTRSSLIRK